jgi:hypothetical protein
MRYRLRTQLRFYAPRWFAALIPVGSDCGSHEWYPAAREIWACYHCRTLALMVDPDEPWVGAPDNEDELVTAAA